MSEVLNNLNVPEASTQSWAQEVAAAGDAEPSAIAPAPAASDPAPAEPETQEAAVEPSDEQETATQEDRRVPLKALQEERQKRAEYERQVQDYQRQLGEWQAWAQQQQMQQPQPEPVPEIDPETDPIGALKAAREQQKQLQEYVAQQQYTQQLQQVAYQAATQYKAAVPDYGDAYQYALQSRAQELAALGTPNHVIGQVLQREELSLIDTALRNGRNPADAIYQFAKARGFQGKTAAAAPATPVPPAPTAAPDPALQQAKAAVAASASSAGAPASKGQLTAADVANLKGAAFDKAWEKLTGGNKSSIFRE